MLEGFLVAIPKHVPSSFSPMSKPTTYDFVSNVTSIYIQIGREHDADQCASGVLDPRPKHQRPRHETHGKGH